MVSSGRSFCVVALGPTKQLHGVESAGMTGIHCAGQIALHVKARNRRTPLPVAGVDKSATESAERGRQLRRPYLRHFSNSQTQSTAHLEWRLSGTSGRP
jgi:hypothetical protein